MNENDTVVVVGGSSGIGLAVARRCLADGARVVIAGRSQQRLDAGEQRTRLTQADSPPSRPTSPTGRSSPACSTAPGHSPISS